MANYNRLKAQKASPIGTIMPWTGSTSQSALAPDAIPKGWIVLNGDQLKAKGKNNLQKEFSPENLRDRLFLERSKETKGYKKDLLRLKPMVTSTFDAITRRKLPTIENFKGKNISYMPHSIRGDSVQYDVSRMIPGTIYFIVIY